MPATMIPKSQRMSEADSIHADMPTKTQKKLILCFDGTGNQYRANTSDTNVVKLYQKFDRQALDQYHYYQREFVFVSPFADTPPSIHPVVENDKQKTVLVLINERSFELSLLTSLSS